MTDTPSLWFVVPAWRRVELARICLAELAHTCDRLCELGVTANAVVVADDQNLDTARELGLGTIDHPNLLGAKINAGVRFAASEGVDYVVTVGSDDLVDAYLIHDQVRRHQKHGRQNTIQCTWSSSAVSPDGLEFTALRIPYVGGDGVRVIPTRMLARVDYQPVAYDRHRGIDGSMRDKLARSGPLHFDYLDSNAVQIVDLKSSDEQLTSYEDLRRDFGVATRDDPWTSIGGLYRPSTVSALQQHYRVPVAA